MSTLLIDDDERDHSPGPEPNWQENYFFLGFDEANQAAFYLHSARLPGRRTVEIKALAALGEHIVSVRRSDPAAANLAVPGLEAEVTKPFQRWHLGYSGTGTEAVAGTPGWLADGPGDVPFGFSLDLESPVAPLDWAPVSVALGVPDILSRHYEAAGHWSGEVRIGGDRAPASGLFIRDHSWGPRDFALFDLAYWAPMYFPDTGAFFSATTILRNGRWTGFLLHDAGGHTEVALDPWMRIDGFPEPGGYDSAAILSPGSGDSCFEFRRLLHVPCRYPEMGDGHVLDDMLSSVTWGDQQGFGVFELNRH